MTHQCIGATRILRRVYSLREPFHQNAVEWLCERTQCRLVDLPMDLDRFLNEQDSCVRDFFIKHTLAVLDAAVTHFGNGRDLPAADSQLKFAGETSSVSTPVTHIDVPIRRRIKEEKISTRLEKA